MIVESKQPIAIVFNPRSGDGKRPAIIAGEMKDLLGERVEIYNFFDILRAPEKIAEKNVITVGGDGTHGTVAILHRRQSPQGWYCAADGGTAGIVAESLGWGRKLRESSQAYAVRISRDVQNQAYNQIHIPLGTRRYMQNNADSAPIVQEDIFFWNIGVGMPLTSGLRAIEKSRETKSFLQRTKQFCESYYHALKRAHPRTIITRGSRRTVFEAHIHKDPFRNVQLFTLPYTGHDILITIPYGKRSNIVRRILIDGMLMVSRLPPIAHGIEIIPLRSHEVVIFEGTAETETLGRVDSEMREFPLPAAVQSNVPQTTGFHVLRRKKQ